VAEAEAGLLSEEAEVGLLSGGEAATAGLLVPEIAALVLSVALLRGEALEALQGDAAARRFEEEEEGLVLALAPHTSDSSRNSEPRRHGSPR
jgi:hypothetical protein